jgi:hypothetical protein
MSSGTDGRQLLKNLAAVAVLLDHPRHASRLALNAADASQQFDFGFWID